MKNWTSIYGNAMSTSEYKPDMYAKDVTLRYPIFCALNAKKLKLTLDNHFCDEEVTISKVTVAISENNLDFVENTNKTVLFNNNQKVTIAPNGQICSDEIDFTVNKGQKIMVSIYLGEFTKMVSGVVTTGPLSPANFVIGDVSETAKIDHNLFKALNTFYFLKQVDALTDDDSNCILCYGDSITAQSWPDYLAQMYFEDNKNTTIIRRAVSGARILRQYNNIPYLSYGASGFNRASHEMDGENVDRVIILQGINDIIHPVGVQTNEFRPWSDLPTVDELINGLRYLINTAKDKGYKVYVGTILPIEGWRTYQPFRNDFRNEINAWIRTTDEIDGYIDFDEAIKDPSNPAKLASQYNSGDNLHPSEAGHKLMAQVVYDYFNGNK